MSTPPLNWTDVEQTLWQAVCRGEPLNVADNLPAGWSEPLVCSTGRQVSAEAIAHLLLQPPSPAPGAVSGLHLVGAHITGQLLLPHATVEIPVSLINCRFDEPVGLNNAALCAADLTGCVLPALHADGLRLDGDLNLARLVAGRISLFGAEIGANLWLNSAQVSADEIGFALHGAQLRVGGGIYAESIRASGGLNLWGADAFAIDVTNGDLSCDTGPALRGDGLSVRQDLRCSKLRTSSGGISLFGAKIGGQFWLNDAQLHNKAGWAINAPNITVGGGIYGRGLAANGGTNLFAATTGESVELPASTLSSDRRPSLRAPASRIRGDVILGEAARIAGDVDLSRSQVTGTLTIAGATFPDTNDPAVNLSRATIGAFEMAGLDTPPAALDIRAANINTIHDEPECWPRRIALDMLAYQNLNPPLPARGRLAWLQRAADGYHPQPYEQLATHYRRLGHDDDARTVLLAQHRHRRHSLRPLTRLWSHLEDATTGYGYRPLRALGWLLTLTTAVAAAFSTAPPRPTRRDGPTFQPIAYALDLILPILDLGQEKAFTPTDATAWIAWASSLAGWVLATTVIAGLTRALTRS